MTLVCLPGKICTAPTLPRRCPGPWSSLTILTGEHLMEGAGVKRPADPSQAAGSWAVSETASKALRLFFRGEARGTSSRDLLGQFWTIRCCPEERLALRMCSERGFQLLGLGPLLLDWAPGAAAENAKVQVFPLRRWQTSVAAGVMCIPLSGSGLGRYHPCIAFGPVPIPTPGLTPGPKCSSS